MKKVHTKQLRRCSSKLGPARQVALLWPLPSLATSSHCARRSALPQVHAQEPAELSEGPSEVLAEEAARADPQVQRRRRDEALPSARRAAEASVHRGGLPPPRPEGRAEGRYAALHDAARLCTRTPARSACVRCADWRPHPLHAAGKPQNEGGLLPKASALKNPTMQRWVVDGTVLSPAAPSTSAAEPTPDPTPSTLERAGVACPPLLARLLVRSAAPWAHPTVWRCMEHSTAHTVLRHG